MRSAVRAPIVRPERDDGRAWKDQFRFVEGRHGTVLDSVVGRAERRFTAKDVRRQLDEADPGPAIEVISPGAERQGPFQMRVPRRQERDNVW